MTDQQISDTKAKQISHVLISKYGVIASPEDVKMFNLGLGLRGEWAHSKKDLIQKYLTEVHGDVFSGTDIYGKFLKSQKPLRKQIIPNFMKY